MNKSVLNFNKKLLIKLILIITLFLGGITFFGCSSNNNTVNSVKNSQTASNIYASKEEALKVLDTLTIAESDGSNYDRKNDYGDWKYVPSKKHNTRFEVLQSQGSDIKIENNKIVGGTWKIPYTGETVTYNTAKEISSGLQIDHIVPISYANQHGASKWSADKKKEFYNDYGQATEFTTGDNDTNDYEKHSNLIVSDSHSNTQKSDKGPCKWLPKNKDYQVEYCEKWINICSYYEISITKADYNAIKSVLS